MSRSILAIGIFIAGSTAALFAAVESLACENAVRDAAFRGPRDLHLLCVIANAEDEVATAQLESLNDWLDGPGRGLNLRLVHVKADDPAVEWMEYGIPSAPPQLPVVALIGKNYGTGESFVINHWEPGPTQDDLAILRHSPTRKILQEELGRQLAVILFAPGTESDSTATHALLEEANRKLLQQNLPGVSVIDLDRTDPDERLLLSFAGIPPEGEDWVGVIFGRGKLMSPPLVGAEINAERLNELTEQLYQDCSCSKPLPSIGVDIPLAWNKEQEDTFQPLKVETKPVDDPRLEALPGVGRFVSTSQTSPPQAAEKTPQTEQAKSAAPIAAEEKPTPASEPAAGPLSSPLVLTVGSVGLGLLITLLLLFRGGAPKIPHIK